MSKPSSRPLIEFELVAFRATVELETPAAVFELLSSARVFYDAVQRHEFRDNYASHVISTTKATTSGEVFT